MGAARRGSPFPLACRCGCGHRLQERRPPVADARAPSGREGPLAAPLVPGPGRKGDTSMTRLAEEMLDDFAVQTGAASARSGTEHHLTDLGNARRLVERHGGNLLYVPARETWCIGDGCRFKRDDILEVENRAKETIRALCSEAADLGDEGARKTLAALALKRE